MQYLEQELMADRRDQTEESQKVCLHELFEVEVRRTPNAVAVISQTEQLTYKELSRQANRLAHYLRSLRVNSETVVAVYMESCLELAISIIAILKAGGVCVPLDPSDPPERQTLLLENTHVPVFLTHKRLANRLPRIDSHVIYTDDFEELLARQSKDILALEIHADNLAFIFSTSGSTGKPKGVMLSHEACSHGLFWAKTTFGLTKQDRHLLKTSISFVSLLRQFIWPLLTGGSTVLLPIEKRGDLAYEAKLVADQRITILTFIPSVLRLFLEQPGVEVCTNLRHVICGAEPIKADVREQFFTCFSAELHNIYALSEAPLVTHWRCKRNSQGTDSAGRVIPGVQVYLLDSNLQPVLVEVEGEVYVGGPVVAQGYLKRPDWTAEKFITNILPSGMAVRLYKTGDRARRLPDGTIEYLGRSDSLVKIHGYRIELGEVETVLHQHPEIKEAVVMVKEDQRRGKRLIAYVVVKRNESSFTFSDLREFLQQKIPQYMIPSALVLLEVLPRLFNGKVDRLSLAQLESKAPATTQAITTPSSGIELQLTRVWEEILGVHPIGVHDNFFDLGGQSLLAVRLFAEIEKAFNKKLPLSALFQAPTIEELSKVLRYQGYTASESSLIPIQTDGSKRPLFCLPSGGAVGVNLGFANLASLLGSDQPVYGLQQQGLETTQTPLYSCIEELAAHYIKEILTIQPNGPYLLAGVCFGGTVAFEIAYQLRTQGHKVALLALLDSYAPKSSSNRRLIPYEALFHRIAFHLSNFFQLGLKEKLVYVVERVKSRFNQIAYSLSLRRGSNLPPVLQYFHAEELNRQLLRDYLPQVYPERVTLFRSSRLIAERYFGNDMGWGKLSAGGVEIHKLPGYFGSILSETQIQVLAEKLRACIDKALEDGQEGYNPEPSKSTMEVEDEASF